MKSYQEHLDKVSRSFAFCIAELEPPLRDQIGLAYILCRIVDTIEDSAWSSTDAQVNSFEKFLHFIQQENIPEPEIQAWISRFPGDIPKHEQELIADAPFFFTDLHQLNEPSRKVLQKSISEMTLGMEFFCSNKTKNGRLKLNSLTETNQYCFFVAGLVGELLTGLAKNNIENFDDSKENLLNAFHFGLYLQKVNILKDQLGDEAEDRFFISSRNDLKASLLHNSKYALEYILRLPRQAKPYRIFCAWSFFLGLASLAWIDKSWEKQKELKISRTETWLLLKQIKKNISDDEFLREKYQELTREQGKTDLQNGLYKAPSQEQLQAHWYHEIYKGPLTEGDFELLGMT